MNSSIRTYEDLLQEQQRLSRVIKTQEELIRKDITGIKEGLKPFGIVAAQIKKMATRDHSAPLMNFGLEFGSDLLLRKFLLAKSGWITKIIIPYLVKNYSSHLFGEEKRVVVMQKVRSFFQKIRSHFAPQSHETEEGSPQTGGAPQQDDFSAVASGLFNNESKPDDEKTM